LEELLPEARIAVAHGQMPERELERVMRDFIAQRYNLLLCSTIIETGIDVPTANTIVMSRADKFGLAQLHQLRGRVGRSHHQAYAYLMVPDIEGLTKQAQPAPGRHPADGRTGQRLLSGHARPGNSRRWRGAG
jgi:transcription-repair coupling factor (superfamily II helicase)